MTTEDRSPRKDDALESALRALAYPAPPPDMTARILAGISRVDAERAAAERRAAEGGAAGPEAGAPPQRAARRGEAGTAVLGLVGVVMAAAAQVLGVLGGQLSLDLPSPSLVGVPSWIADGLVGVSGLGQGPFVAVLLLHLGILLFGVWLVSAGDPSEQEPCTA